MLPLPLLLMMACARDAVGVGAPWLDVPDALAIPGARFDEVTTVALPVRSSGTADAELAVTVDGPFDVEPRSATLAPGATLDLVVSFEPASADPASGALTLSTGLDAFEVRLSASVDPDADDDGHADPRAGGDDCDDRDPERAPGLGTFAPDADHDGFGDAGAAPVEACEPPKGHVADASDCDDAAPDVHPGAAETWYDGVDQDCAGDDDFDRDADGHRGPRGAGDDCDDRDPEAFPGAPEVWYDGVDQDCAGDDDFDRDADGERDPSGGGLDCDDRDPEVRPGAAELDDGVDQDCDGLRDEDLWAHGSLLVTEILRDPVAVTSAHGRYVEVTNPTDGDVDLGRVEVVLGSRTAPLDPAWLPPGGVALLCIDEDPAQNGGLSCGGRLPWIGAPASVELRVVGDGTRLDAVPVGGWRFPSGAAIELASDALDPDLNDQPSSWCASTDAAPSGDLGTPGRVDPPCP